MVLLALFSVDLLVRSSGALLTVRQNGSRCTHHRVLVDGERHNRLLEQPATRIGGRGKILAAAAQQLSVMRTSTRGALL